MSGLEFERGSTMTEVAIIAFPAFSMLLMFVALVVAYTSQVTAELQVVETNLASLGQYEYHTSLYNYKRVPAGSGPKADRWPLLFVNHLSNSAKNDAIATAQSVYGLDPNDYSKVAYLDFVAGQAKGRAVGFTSSTEYGVRQVGATYITPTTGNVQEFFGIRTQILRPGLIGDKIVISANFARGLS